MERLDHPELQLRLGRHGRTRHRTVRHLLPRTLLALTSRRFTAGKPYWTVPLAIALGLLLPIPFWLVHRYSARGSWAARAAAYVHTPIVALYVGYLPYSVNGQWWSCVVLGLATQWWARRRRPAWFRKYNYLTSAALDGGSQVILFILVSLRGRCVPGTDA